MTPAPLAFQAPEAQIELLRAATELASGSDFAALGEALDALGPPPRASIQPGQPLDKLQPAVQALRAAEQLMDFLARQENPEADEAVWRLVSGPWGRANLGSPSVSLAARACALLALSSRRPEGFAHALEIFQDWTSQGLDLFFLDPLRPCQGPCAWPSGSPQALELANFLAESLHAQALRQAPDGSLTARALSTPLLFGDEDPHASDESLRALFSRQPALWAGAARGPRPPLLSAVSFAWSRGWDSEADAMLQAAPQAALEAVSCFGALDPFQAACSQALDPLRAVAALERAGAELGGDLEYPGRPALMACAERGPVAAGAAAWLRERMDPQDVQDVVGALNAHAWRLWDARSLSAGFGVGSEGVAKWARVIHGGGANAWPNLKDALEQPGPDGQTGEERLVELCQLGSSHPRGAGLSSWKELAGLAAEQGAPLLFKAALNAWGRSPTADLLAGALNPVDASRSAHVWRGRFECMAHAQAQGCALHASRDPLDSSGESLAERALDLLATRDGNSREFDAAKQTLLSLGKLGVPLPNPSDSWAWEWAGPRAHEAVAQAKALRENFLLEQSTPEPMLSARSPRAL